MRKIFSIIIPLLLFVYAFAQDSYEWGQWNYNNIPFSVVSDVYNQNGGNCDIYAIISAAEMKYNYSQNLNKKINEPTYDSRILLSCSFPIYVVDNDDAEPNMALDGVIMENLSKYGTCLEKDFPSYLVGAVSNVEMVEPYKSQIPYMYRIKFPGYRSFSYGDMYSLDFAMYFNYRRMDGISYTVDDIKHAISTYGPVVAGVNSEGLRSVYTDNNPLPNTYHNSWPGGIINYSPNSHKTTDHAIVLLGWGTETVNNEQIEYWKVLNSWGTKEYGDNGYFKVAINSLGISTSKMSYFDEPPKLYYPNNVDDLIVTSDSGFVTNQSPWETTVCENAPVTIDSGGNMHMYNTTAITLKSGFHAKEGSVFIAKIQPVYDMEYYETYGDDYNPTNRVKVYSENTELTNSTNASNVENYDIFGTNDLNVFPNPSSGTFSIVGEVLNSSLVELIDSKGNVVYSKTLNNTASDVLLTGFTTGMYIARIISANNVICKKVIVK